MANPSGPDNLPNKLPNKVLNNLPDKSLIEFPADLSIKAMGLANEDFESLVFDIVAAHVEDQGDLSVSRLQSSKGKYVSVRVQLKAQSQQQLKAIYADLHANERVLYTL